MKPVKPRLKITFLGVKHRTYMLRLRLMINGVVTPAGGKGEHDIFIMQDIENKKPEDIIKAYNRNNLHVVHIMPIPDWEGAPQ